MAKTADKNLELEQIYIILAYFHGYLDKNETIYVKLPPEYITNSGNCIVLLNSAFYELK